MILDTAFLIDLMNGDDGAIEKAKELEEELVQQRISSMTLFELFYGIARAVDSDAEREAVMNVIESKPIYPADAAVMKKAGHMAGELKNSGSPVGGGDVIIGATGSILEEAILTRNLDDFERIGVQVEAY